MAEEEAPTSPMSALARTPSMADNMDKAYQWEVELSTEEKEEAESWEGATPRFGALFAKGLLAGIFIVVRCARPARAPAPPARARCPRAAAPRAVRLGGLTPGPPKPHPCAASTSRTTGSTR